MHNKLEDPESTFHVLDDTTGFGSSVLSMDDSGVAEDDITSPEDERNIMHYSITDNNISQMFASLSIEVRQVIVPRQEFDRFMTPRRPRRR